jgi:hypothetical protein
MIRSAKWSGAARTGRPGGRREVAKPYGTRDWEGRLAQGPRSAKTHGRPNLGGAEPRRRLSPAGG